ncbi:MAG: response regulator [Deltaproteobacteria bacterium]|nr:response regulator [Deltaproteobacteria bacterium]
MADSAEMKQNKAKILVVEDSPTQVEELRFILEAAGFSVVVATNGKEGLAAAKTSPVDLVISDIVMPEMDGYELCKALRADEALRHLPAILLTSHADPRDVIRGLESGANNFICKPYDNSALIARVNNILANQEIRKAASSELGISIFFAGQRFFITADRLQILDLLLSTYENAVNSNSELIRTRDELRVLNEQLEARVAERTAALTAEVEERQRTQHDLEASEARYRRLFECAKDGILILDAGAGKIIDVNPFLMELTGYPHDHFLGKHLWEIGPFNDIAASENAFAELQAKEYVRYEDLPLETRDGRKISVEFISNVYRVDGQCVIQCNIRDITARKRAEEALRASREVLQAVLNTIPIRVFWKNRNLTYLGCNMQFARDAGFETPEDLIGKDDDAMAWREHAELYRADDRAVIESGQAKLLFEEPLTNPAGETGYVLTSKVPLRDAKGDIVGVLGAYQDITERKQAETQRQRLEEQLRASQKMESIGSLAGGVAHDFNNLLSVILSYTGFAMGTVQDGDPLKDDLLEVKKAADRAVALTRQLLAFSRKQILQPEPLDLNQTAAGVEKMLRRILGEDIDYAQALASVLGLTLADPGQIEQVIMNLVVNARDAMPAGGKLTIETSNVEIDEEYAARHVAVKPGSYVQLVVTDTGCGMDDKTKTRLFEPFFTTKGKGTGLGLSTVYGIVKQSGGNIWVYSELGKGTTFKIYLPRALAAAPATTVKPAPIETPPNGTETILVVEDEEALRRVAQRSLEATGYKVLTAANGDEALLTGARHVGEIHLLLTDVVMPRMSGKTLAQELSKTRPTLKVVYMSGYTDNAIVHHGVLDAGTHFLAKPFTSTDLTRKVREVLDGGIQVFTTTNPDA